MIDLLKVDTEGAEMDVLQGMTQLLDKSQDLKLIIEFSPTLLCSAGANPVQLLVELGARGFEVACITDQMQPSPLPIEDRESVVDHLLKSEASINLFCFGR